MRTGRTKGLRGVLLLALVTLVGGMLGLPATPAHADVISNTGTTLPWSASYTSAVSDGVQYSYIFDTGYGNGRIMRYSIITNQVIQMNGQLPSSPGNGQTGAAVWANGRAFVFGGIDNRIWKYNPGTDIVTQMASTLPQGWQHNSAVYDGSQYAYIFGGLGGGSPYGQSDKIYKYDTINDTITQMTAVLPTVRFGTSAIWAAGKAYIFGGERIGPQVLYSDILRYDAALDQITLVANLPTARYLTAAAWTGADAFIFGGNEGPCATCQVLTQIVAYVPVNNTVKVMSQVLPQRVQGLSATFTNKTGTLFGGCGNTACPLNQVLRYRPQPAAPPFVFAWSGPWVGCVTVFVISPATNTYGRNLIRKNIHRGLTPAVSYVGWFPSGATWWFHCGLTSGTTYFFRFSAQNLDGAGPLSGLTSAVAL